MPRRYRKLRGDTAYYPFAARTGLRARQRRHARLLRVLGTAALAWRRCCWCGRLCSAAASLPPRADCRRTDHRPGQAYVTVAPVAATRDALADTREADAAAHTTPESAAAPTVESTAILPQYRALYEENPDLVGWLRIDGTDIDLPVVQTPGDNEYYLRRGFDRFYAMGGTLFLDERCSLPDAPADNWLDLRPQYA